MRICRGFENRRDLRALSGKSLWQKSCYQESFRFLWLWLCLLMPELTWSAYLLKPKLHLSNFFFFNIHTGDGLCLGQALFTPFLLLTFSLLCLLLLFKMATCTPMKSMNTAATIIISRQSRQSSSRLGLAAPPATRWFSMHNCAPRLPAQSLTLPSCLEQQCALQCNRK